PHTRDRGVISKLWGQLNPALPWGVAPRPTGFDGWIEVVVKAGQLTGLSGRSLRQRVNAIRHFWIAAVYVGLVIRAFDKSRLRGGLGDAAITVHNPGVRRGRRGSELAVVIAKQLVPHYLVAGLGNRKWNA